MTSRCLLFKIYFWNFPGAPVVRTLHFQCWGGQGFQSMVREEGFHMQGHAPHPPKKKEERKRKK